MVQAAHSGAPSCAATNRFVAAQLAEAAALLERQGANRFRVTAYRRAAETVRALGAPVAQLCQEHGQAGLRQLPGVGASLAQAIEQLVRTGRLPLLVRLRGDQAPGRLLATVADIGPTLAARIHETLGIDTLADLEAASWDGRLARVAGMGPKRLQAVRESLAGRAADRPARGAPRPLAPPADAPGVGELLSIDEEYRRLAARDRLVRVAPRRFNPEGRAWLPILHAVRDDRRYTAMFSNTGRAHELGATHDWVVIYREGAAGGGPWTVVSARLGALRGRRIVRGREDECAAWYAARS